MNRPLQYINFFGVVALTVLCLFQWQHDRQLNLEINRLEKTRLAQEQKFSEQDRALQGVTRDLEFFKNQFTVTQSNLLSTRKTVEATEREKSFVTFQQEQLKASVTNWVKAVAARDERLAEMEKQAHSLAEKSNESIRKFNELATNYNSVVDQLNALRKQTAGAPDQPSVKR